MATFNVQQCPVCDGTHFSEAFQCTDHFVSQETFPVKKCASCGLRITENAEDEENIGRYYQSEEYVSHSNTTKGLVNKIYHTVRKFMLGQKRRLIEKTAGKNPGHIIDVGAGTGFFLDEMKRHGWQIDGTEKSKEARKFAKSAFGLHLHEPEGLFQMKKESADAITLWHVLEHIHHLDDNMQAIHEVLKPEGHLIIAVPNPESTDARHYKEYWAAWDVPRHLWHFGPDQMKKLGRKFGFKLVVTKPMPFDAFYVSLLSEKYKKSSFPLLKGFFHGKISWLSSFIQTRKCSSLIYVFKKE